MRIVHEWANDSADKCTTNSKVATAGWEPMFFLIFLVSCFWLFRVQTNSRNRRRILFLSFFGHALGYTGIPLSRQVNIARNLPNWSRETGDATSFARTGWYTRLSVVGSHLSARGAPQMSPQTMVFAPWRFGETRGFKCRISLRYIPSSEKNSVKTPAICSLCRWGYSQRYHQI